MDCDNKADKLRGIVTPLSELEEREVGMLEVKGVKRDEEHLMQELGQINAALVPIEKEIQALDGAVKELINSDKDDRLACAVGKLADLDIKVDELEQRRDQALRKLDTYQNLIRAAKADQGRTDASLMATLRKLETEAGAIERDLRDIDKSHGDLTRKRNETKRFLDEVSGALHKYTPAQIDTTIGVLDDQSDKAKGLVKKAKDIEEDLDRRILDL
jgi:chromosome segregation ATPase